MKDQMEVLVKKIDYLYQKIEEVIDERSSKQMDFLLNEIDTNRTKLLELEIQEYYKELDDETVKVSSVHYEMEREDEEEKDKND